MTPVSIIIPAWNLWNLTHQCLESIARALSADNLHANVEIIVVNNGSTDATKEALAPTLARLFGENGKEVRLAENMGFAKGCNTGAAAATHPLLLFLNNDTIVTKGFLQPLVHTLTHSQHIGMTAPLLLYPDNTLQHCGITFTPTLAPRHLYEFYPATHPLIKKNRTLQALTGAAFLIPTPLFHDCGGFHEAYKNGFEDIDLCVQVRKKKLSLLCVHSSVVYHLASQSPGRFDHDPHNARILTERCAQHLSPDMHKILTKDGLTPTLDSILRLMANMSAQKEAALTNYFQKEFHEEKCQRRLEAEPLWFTGYILLSTHYAQHAQWDNSLKTLTRLLTLAPTKAHWQIFLKTSTTAKNTQHIENAKNTLNTISEHEQKHQENKQKAEQIHANALEHNDAILQKLAKDWLEKYTQ